MIASTKRPRKAKEFKSAERVETSSESESDEDVPVKKAKEQTDVLDTATPAVFRITSYAELFVQDDFAWEKAQP
uniref:DEAD/DEAH box helicase n=1 Tax=Rhabditophanes sp. KR3021 TaxID=114890 RepID=A0AC35UBZ0_9BILA